MPKKSWFRLFPALYPRPFQEWSNRRRSVASKQECVRGRLLNPLLLGSNAPRGDVRCGD